MIPKEAIEKAIKGGWNMGGIATAHTIEHRGDRICFENGKSQNGISKMYTQYPLSTVALDPLFWQALFKEYQSGASFKMRDQCFPQWHQQANIFYDLILTGGDTKKFWDDLLT